MYSIHILLRSLSILILVHMLVPATGMAAQPSADDVLQGMLDGENRTWSVIERDGQSTATFVKIAPDIWRFNIQGNAGDEFTIKNSLSLSFTVIAGTVQPATVSYFPEPAMMPVYTVPGSMGLQLDDLQIDGDSARVAGRFRDDLPYQADQDAEPDSSRAVTLELEFDISAILQEQSD